MTRFMVEGYAEAQQMALYTAPRLAAAFGGERIDWFFRQAVGADPRLWNVTMTARGVFGPDVVGLDRFWDVTTMGQWGAHVARYAAYGQGIGLLYGF